MRQAFLALAGSISLRQTLTAISLVLTAGWTNAQDLAWARSVRESSAYGSFNGVAVRPDGTVLAAGRFSTSATVGYGESTQDTFYTPTTDALIACHGVAGDYQWAVRSISPGNGACTSEAIAAGPDGSFFVVGPYYGPVLFGAGFPTATYLNSDGPEVDAFVAKYQPDRSLAWIRRLSGPLANAAVSVQVAGDGTIFVAGYFLGPMVLGEGEVNQTVLASSGQEDGFVAKFSASGMLLWARRAGGSSYDFTRRTAPLSDGGCVVVGNVNGTGTLDSTGVSPSPVGGLGDNDGFIARYASDGQLLWARTVGGTGSDGVFGLAIAPDDAITIVGSQGGSARFGFGEPTETELAGAAGGFVAKYGPTGALLWARDLGQPGATPLSIARRGDGSFTVAGRFTGTSFIESGPANAISSAGASDTFVGRVAANGALAWVRRAGGSGEDVARSIAVAPMGEVVIAGEFTGAATLGQGPSAVTLQAQAGVDPFVAKYVDDFEIPPTSPIVQILHPTAALVVGSTQVQVIAQITHPAATTVTSLPAGVNASLTGDGQASGVVTLSAEGPNTITVNAVDTFGNPGGSSVEVIVDTLAPQVTVLAPAANAIVGTPVVTVTVRVTDTTATTVSIGGVSAPLPAGGGDAQLTVPVAEGLNALTILVTDAAAHPTSVPHPVWRDSTTPLLTIDTPTNGAIFGVGQTALYVQATVDDASPTTVTSTPGGVAASLPSGGGIADGTVNLVEGANTITVYVTDGINAAASQSVTVVLDATGPDVAIASPGPGAFLAGIVDFDVLATDPTPGSGVVEVRLFVDDTLLATDTTAPYEFDLDTSLLADGAHVLRATAVDGKGNSNTDSIPVVVDNTAPVLTLVAPLANATVQGSFPIRFDVADATAGVVQVTMTAGGLAPTTDGSATYPTPVAGTQITGNEDSLRWPDGPLQLRATARDASGNETSLAWTVQVGNSIVPPTCTLNVLDQTTVSGAVLLRATATGSFTNITLAIDGVVIASGPSSPLEISHDTLARFDGPMLVQATVTQANQQTVGCAVTLHVDNLAVVDLAPQTLNLDAGSADNGRPVDALVEGLNVASILPLANHSVLLLVPGGSPVALDPATPAQNPGDDNGNTIPDVTLRFVRSALVASLRAGIANGSIVLDNRKADVTLTVIVDGRVLGSTTMKIITKKVR